MRNVLATMSYPVQNSPASLVINVLLLEPGKKRLSIVFRDDAFLSQALLANLFNNHVLSALLLYAQELHRVCPTKIIPEVQLHRFSAIRNTRWTARHSLLSNC